MSTEPVDLETLNAMLEQAREDERARIAAEIARHGQYLFCEHGGGSSHAERYRQLLVAWLMEGGKTRDKHDRTLKQRAVT